MKTKSGLQIASIFSAIIASSCCWLPFVLLFFGISSSTMGSFFSRYRLLLNIGAFIFLGIGFYLQYFHKKNICCDDKQQKTSIFTKFSNISLWITTIIVIGFFILPMYMNYLPNKQKEPSCNTKLLNKIDNIENKASTKKECCP